MIQNTVFKRKEYKRAAQLLENLFEVDQGVSEKINKCIEEYGITEVFKNIESFDFQGDVREKLESVRLVLVGIGEIS